MEEEIDLRPYIELLIKRWYLILGVAALAALIAFGVTALQDPVYEAIAHVAVTQERLVAQFDPRLATSEERQPVDALPELALSDQFLSVLMAEIDPQLDGIDSLAVLRRMLSAEAGDDPSLIRLTVQHGKPETAAKVANLWGQQFVLLANEIYGDGGNEQVSFFEGQLAQSSDILETAENELIAFQRVNRMAVISDTLSALQNQRRNQISGRQQEIKNLIHDVEDLHSNISEKDSSTPISFADQLTALTLQLRAYDAVQDLPIQYQLDSSESLGESTRSDQIASLETLSATLQARLEEIDQYISDLEPKILQLQGDLQASRAEYNRLTIDRNIALETYQSLARKVDEERITAQDTTRGIRLASEAAVPENPGGRSGLFAAFMVFVVTVLLVSFILILVAWWRGNDVETRQE